jgi:hypothetical protein
MTWTSIQRISTASRNLILETTLLTVLSKFSFYFLVLLSISFSLLFCTVSCSWFWSFYHFDRYERGIYVMLYMENWFGKSMRNFSKVIIFFSATCVFLFWKNVSDLSGFFICFKLMLFSIFHYMQDKVPKYRMVKSYDIFHSYQNDVPVESFEKRKKRKK